MISDYFSSRNQMNNITILISFFSLFHDNQMDLILDKYPKQ